MGAIKNLYRYIKYFRILNNSSFVLASFSFRVGKGFIFEGDKSSKVVAEGSFDICNYVVMVAFDHSEIRLGKNVYIGDYSTIRGTKCIVEIGANTMIAQSVKIIGMNHYYQDKSQPISSQDIDYKKLGVTIGEDVWIGAGACILPGVNIGKGAVIGAMTLVNKNVEEYTVVVGNPARVIKKRS
jgi:acetyltransferase-like isoleucine patch superfamily enzyme